MRMADGIQDCVVFVGHEPNGPGTFIAHGTAFFVVHDGYIFLVTAQHIAGTLGDVPFHVRFNLKAGGTEAVHIDPLAYHPHPSWYFHPDPAVDMAVMPMRIPRERFAMKAIPSSMIPSIEDEAEYRIGPGDLCYAVGLFRPLQGEQRNIPVVHTGNVALMAGAERVPISDWRRGGRIMADAHLVVLQNLRGLSGSPVFVRPCYSQAMQGPRGDVAVLQYSASLALLGVWSGSWEAEADELLALNHRNAARVPVGFGTVTPSHYLREILDLPEMVWLRAMFREVERLVKSHSTA